MEISEFPDLSSPHQEALLRALGQQHDGGLFEADTTFRQLIRQRPLHPVVANTAAGFALLKGAFADAWTLFEHRLELPYYTHRPFMMMPQPMWDGVPMPDKRLLIFADMGLGDTILLARFIPWARARVGHLHLQVNEGTDRFWRRIFPESEISVLGDPLPDCDVRLNMFCLPRVFGADSETLPTAPYLDADPAVRQIWRQKLDGKFNVGLCWQGNPDHVRDWERSIPLEQFQPLIQDSELAAAGVKFFSLQVGHGRDQMEALSSEPAVVTDLGIDIMAADDPLGVSAALVADLDLVISIDSGLANLAGAMGRPFWLPTYKIPDWRWVIYPGLTLEVPEIAPWYGTQKIYSSIERGQWAPVIEAMLRDLRAIVADQNDDR